MRREAIVPLGQRDLTRLPTAIKNKNITGVHKGQYCPSQVVGSPIKEMDSLACKPNGKAENHQMEDLQAHPLLLKPTTTEMQGDEFWPLSGKPYFHIILTRSHVKPLYQMVIPAKIHSVLPSATIPVVLTYRDKNWEAVYHGEHRSHKRFNHSWKTFVNDNNLKTGDACVFELMECNSRNLKFRVQVLRGDIPSKLLDKVNGESVNSPIVIE